MRAMVGLWWCYFDATKICILYDAIWSYNIHSYGIMVVAFGGDVRTVLVRSSRFDLCFNSLHAHGIYASDILVYGRPCYANWHERSVAKLLKQWRNLLQVLPGINFTIFEFVRVDDLWFGRNLSNFLEMGGHLHTKISGALFTFREILE